MSSMDVPSDSRESPTSTRRAGPAGVRAVVAAAPRMSWLTLALMTTSSVASLRAAPTMAVFRNVLRDRVMREAPWGLYRRPQSSSYSDRERNHRIIVRPY